mgnify:FL=1
MLENDIEVRFNTKQLPFEYKLLEYRLIVNKELYDEKVIDLRTYNEMENSIMGRLKKVRQEYLLNEKNDLTNADYGATIQVS